ncbi:MAG: MBL fold metallo-hydrolase [Planctomycetales bacterium]|nr:MBL fold metallo-hydrolase [Planctomycetales bacterium]
MALAADILENIRGFSKAMYSTWVFYRPARALFDAGEGVATALGNFVFAVEQAFLSHGHYDHVGGVAGFVLARAAAMGEKTKPLEIHYPEGDGLVEMARDYARRIGRNVQYPLAWKAIGAGAHIRVTGTDAPWRVRSFRTSHVRGMLTLGYALEETRRRLRPELQGLPEDEIKKRARSGGRDAVTEEYRRTLLAYTGDAMPVDPADVRGAVVLMHDATFLDGKDRETKTHATVEEALDVAKAAEVETLLLYHVSTRYRRRDIEAGIRDLARKRGLAAPLHLLHLGKLAPLPDGMAGDADSTRGPPPTGSGGAGDAPRQAPGTAATRREEPSPPVAPPKPAC